MFPFFRVLTWRNLIKSSLHLHPQCEGQISTPSLCDAETCLMGISLCNKNHVSWLLWWKLQFGWRVTASSTGEEQREWRVWKVNLCLVVEEKTCCLLNDCSWREGAFDCSSALRSSSKSHHRNLKFDSGPNWEPVEWDQEKCDVGSIWLIKDQMYCCWC